MCAGKSSEPAGESARPSSPSCTQQRWWVRVLHAAPCRLARYSTQCASRSSHWRDAEQLTACMRASRSGAIRLGSRGRRHCRRLPEESLSVRAAAKRADNELRQGPRCAVGLSAASQWLSLTHAAGRTNTPPLDPLAAGEVGRALPILVMRRLFFGIESGSLTCSGPSALSPRLAPPGTWSTWQAASGRGGGGGTRPIPAPRAAAAARPWFQDHHYLAWSRPSCRSDGVRQQAGFQGKPGQHITAVCSEASPADEAAAAKTAAASTRGVLAARETPKIGTWTSVSGPSVEKGEQQLGALGTLGAIVGVEAQSDWQGPKSDLVGPLQAAAHKTSPSSTSPLFFGAKVCHSNHGNAPTFPSTRSWSDDGTPWCVHCAACRGGSHGRAPGQGTDLPAAATVGLGPDSHRRGQLRSMHR